MEQVVVIMGSTSDAQKVEPAIQILREFNIEVGVYCISAHRAPDGLKHFVKKINDSGHTLVIIAAAGKSAALPGVIASGTVVPVIGLPLGGTPLSGKEALYSMTEMPPGVPVATVGIDAAKNAGLLAIRIIATQVSDLALELERYYENLAKKSLEVNEQIHMQYAENHSSDHFRKV
ncbi:5-(carboxyamino)imidazole ribonucleotide mutase [Candidatus Saccharibacteria bacterium]|nr:5-(carboxyamino)imidazole ribonucleotide mutase [Candidatus Saccharibacteria bacterium]